MLYRYIVERRLRHAFAALNRGDYGPILKSFGTPLEHTFHGSHALGGSRHTMASVARWYERLRAIFPDLHFDLDSVVVRGWPWHTVAVCEWRDQFGLPDGQRRGNQGVHVLRLRWGRVVSLRIHCDTQRLVAALDALAAQGVEAAEMAPIADPA
jgi:ketosteroid isomerase-like protein